MSTVIGLPIDGNIWMGADTKASFANTSSSTVSKILIKHPDVMMGFVGHAGFVDFMQIMLPLMDFSNLKHEDITQKILNITSLFGKESSLAQGFYSEFLVSSQGKLSQLCPHGKPTQSQHPICILAKNREGIVIGSGNEAAIDFLKTVSGNDYSNIIRAALAASAKANPDTVGEPFEVYLNGKEYKND